MFTIYLTTVSEALVLLSNSLLIDSQYKIDNKKQCYKQYSHVKHYERMIALVINALYSTECGTVQLACAGPGDAEI